MDAVRIRRSNRIFILSLWIIPIVFYLIFWLIDGAVWCADSDSYVAMHDCREPLYPTLLAFLRFVCRIGMDADPENNMSLTVMALLQSILAGVSAGSLTTFLTEVFLGEAIFDGTLYGRRMNTAHGLKLCRREMIRQRLAAYVILMIAPAVSLLNRFAAGRASMYSNSILTEGLAISIYILAFRYMLDYMIRHRRYSYVMSCIMVLAGITLRKQMYVLLCLFIIVGIYTGISNHNVHGKRAAYAMKKLIGTAVMALVIVSVALLLDCVYNKAVRNVFIIHTEDNRFVTTMALYTSEREYADYVESELRDVYLKIYDVCDENNRLMHDAPVGWYDRVEYFADNYDHIQLDTMQLILEDYADTAQYSGFVEGMTKTEKIDAVRSSFNRSLIPHEYKRLLRVVIDNILCGLVNTAAKRTPLLCVYSALAYVMYIILLIKSRGIYRLAAAFTLLSIAGNVALVSAVIFCQTRYMIYNMPLFYITVAVLLTGMIFREKRLQIGTGPDKQE